MPTGAALLALAHGSAVRVALLPYCLALSGCLGTSAAYHRLRWSPRLRPVLCRIDHAMIFVLIAGTYTPVCLLGLRGALGAGLLAAVWAGAALGIALAVLWPDAPAFIEVAPYVLVGWIGAAGLPAIVSAVGLTVALLLIGGGVAYTAGAVVYWRERPDPVPAVFGFHEVFHVLVLVGVAAHLGAIGLLAAAQ